MEKDVEKLLRELGISKSNLESVIKNVKYRKEYNVERNRLMGVGRDFSMVCRSLGISEGEGLKRLRNMEIDEGNILGGLEGLENLEE